MFSPDGYQALTRFAGVVRRGDRGILTVTGPDRLAWLQGLLTNDVAALPAGGICDAAYLTPQGRMISDMRVLQREDRTWLDVPAPLAASLQTRLEALLFAEEAQIADSSAELVLIDIHGPRAEEIVSGLAAVRDDAYGVPGFSVVTAAGEADALVATLVSRGAMETSLATLDVLRVEAGRPAFLLDMDEHTIPLEAGLEDRAISFTKGCYVGQEVIVRVLHRGGGRVARRLVGIKLAPGATAKAGERLLAETRDVGGLTSAVWSPAAEVTIGLGYVHRDFATPGTVLHIASPSGKTPAQVTALPIVTHG